MKGKYKAVNLGENGYCAFQEYTYLSYQLANGLKPDLIVSYDGVNQLKSLQNINEGFGSARENQIQEMMKGKDTKKDLEFNMIIKPINDFIVKLVEKYNNKNKQEELDLSEKNIESAAKEVIESWMLINNLAKINNSKYIIILQPNLYIGNPKKDHLILREERGKAYKLLYKKIKDMIKLEKYKDIYSKFYDFTNAYDNEQYLYCDDCHVSPVGNEIIAKKIINILNN